MSERERIFLCDVTDMVGKVGQGEVLGLANFFWIVDKRKELK